VQFAKALRLLHRSAVTLAGDWSLTGFGFDLKRENRKNGHASTLFLVAMNTLSLSRNAVFGSQCENTVVFVLKERKNYSSLTSALDIMIVLF
jgi:hypothetical protein